MEVRILSRALFDHPGRLNPVRSDRDHPFHFSASLTIPPSPPLTFHVTSHQPRLGFYDQPRPTTLVRLISNPTSLAPSARLRHPVSGLIAPNQNRQAVTLHFSPYQNRPFCPSPFLSALTSPFESPHPVPRHDQPLHFSLRQVNSRRLIPALPRFPGPFLL